MFRKSLILFCTTIMLCSPAIAAPNFPAKSDASVQDSQKLIDSSQEKQLSDIIEKLPEKYKVVIVSSTDGETTQQYTDELFSNYKMANDQILFVLNMDKGELAAHVGTIYSGKGLTNGIIKDKIDKFFVPPAKQESYMTGILSVAQQISSFINNGNKPSDGATAQGAVQKAQSSSSLPSWVYILSVIVLAILFFSFFTFMQRRKLFKEMDEIEDWMDAIEDKLKSLKPDPSYEKQGKADAVSSLIEVVRKEYLPAAEISLIEAETLSDRFRFLKAVKQLQHTRDQLGQIDNEISQLQSKMFQSKVAFEESGRLIEEIQKANTLVERKLDEARFQHGVSFQDLREKWVEVDKRFKTVSIDHVEDYSNFLNELKEMKQVLVDILKEIERYPHLKQEITLSIPKEIRELEMGIQEMVMEGYKIPENYFEGRLYELNQEIETFQSLLSEGLLSELELKVEGVKEQIDAIYDTIEEIVTKKAMVQHFFAEIPETLYALNQERDQLSEELEELSLRYLVNEGPIFTYYLNLQNLCQFVDDQLFLARQMNSDNDLEYIQAAEILEKTSQEVHVFIETREEAYQELEELRKGEYEAQETVMKLHSEIVRIEQQIRRQHLPGIPPIMTSMIEEGKQALFEIEFALNQVPLDLQKVNTLVKQAREFNAKLNHHAEALFYHCLHAEEKIQQTNRYRSHWNDVNELLIEAERAFRELDFEKAHLLAAKANDLANQYLEGLGRLQFKKKKA